MTSPRPAHMLSWSSENHHRLETVRTMVTDRGVRANGYIIRADSDDGFGCSYSILADSDGRARRLSVQSDAPDGERHLSLTRTPDGPWVLDSTSGSTPLAEFDTAFDVDLQSSVFTNSLALKRIGLVGPEVAVGTQVTVTVVRVSLPDLSVSPVDYHYTALGDNRIAYRGPMGEVTLTIDDEGFILDFPNVSHRLG